jgi:hypothetical protein
MQSSFGVEQQQDRNIRQQNRSVIGARVHHACVVFVVIDMLMPTVSCNKL